MCLATPMQITSIDGTVATVESAGVQMDIGLDLVDEAAVGDFVIVHAGYAIQRLSQDEAQETLAILERLRQSWEQ